MGEVTRLISAIRSGDEDGTGTDRLFAIVYDQLRRMARRQLNGENANSTWQPTSLVNEAFLKLVRADEIEWQDRLHFFRAAGQAMRRILIDRARYQKRIKRGGKLARKHFCEGVESRVAIDRCVSDRHDRLLDLNEALIDLENVSPERAELVRLHFFAGLTLAQCAEILDVSISTIERQWRCTKAWLRLKMD